MDWDEAPTDDYETEATLARLWVPCSGVVVTRVSGVGSLEIIRVYTNRMDRLLMVRRGIRVFHHWHALTSFEPDARAHLRAWASSRKEMLADAHYLVSSKIVSMAIAAAALALGRELVGYTDEAKFTGMLDEAIRDAVRTELEG